MKIQTIQITKKKQSKNETLLIPLFEYEKFEGDFLTENQVAEVKEAMKEKEFLGKKGEIFVLPKLGSTGRCVLLGLGKKDDFTLTVYQRSLGTAVCFLQSRKMLDFTFFLSESIERKLAEVSVIRFSATVFHVSSYQFNTYFTDKSRVLPDLRSVALAVFGKRKKTEDEQQLKEGRAIGEAANFTRHLGNMPPVEMTPSCLAAEAKKLSKKHPKLKVRALGRKEIQKEKMGGLLGVAAGSSEEPKFIILEWMNAPKEKGTRVFAGKAITFDSGGLSIKPADKMDEMKFDMLGGGAVLGAMKAIAELGLKVNIVGLISATENLSGSKAYRPGDILRAKNGKTMEILNTDAEGRVVLSDALSYASKYKPKFVIDLATLTGACVVALGGSYAGLFTREKKCADAIYEASRRSGENVWPLPLDDDFVEDVKSDVADVRNIGKSGREGGASSAAAFLEAFTDYPWAHLDIAGVAWSGEKPHIHAGATGYGVSLLVELAKGWERERK